MAAPKKNKDGLLGGKLVTPKQHAEVMRKKRQELARKIAEPKKEPEKTGPEPSEGEAAK